MKQYFLVIIVDSNVLVKSVIYVYKIIQQYDIIMFRTYKNTLTHTHLFQNSFKNVNLKMIAECFFNKL